MDGESTFQTLVSDTTVGPDAWVEFAGTYTPTGQADAIHLYAESASALVDFYLDDFVLSVDTPPDIEEDIPSLKDVLADDFPIGVAIDARETVGAPATLLTKHFNSITAENHMKPETIQPAEGEFDFGPGDELVEFAEANGVRVYGHTLVWHSQTPDWFFEDADGNPLTNSPEHQQLLLDRMETHIRTVAAHYGDRIWAWDVVNEVIDESQADGMRRSQWYEILGPDYVAHAFRIARDAFGPDVKLFINDYNTEFPAKREAMYQLVSRLLADGVPIDGIGHQLHVNLSRPISWVDDSIERFAELGLAQAVTELDVSVSESSQDPCRHSSGPAGPPGLLLPRPVRGAAGPRRPAGVGDRVGSLRHPELAAYLADRPAARGAAALRRPAAVQAGVLGHRGPVPVAAPVAGPRRAGRHGPGGRGARRPVGPAARRGAARR